MKPTQSTRRQHRHSAERHKSVIRWGKSLAILCGFLICASELGKEESTMASWHIPTKCSAYESVAGATAAVSPRDDICDRRVPGLSHRAWLLFASSTMAKVAATSGVIRVTAVARSIIDSEAMVIQRVEWNRHERSRAVRSRIRRGLFVALPCAHRLYCRALSGCSRMPESTVFV